MALGVQTAPRWGCVDQAAEAVPEYREGRARRLAHGGVSSVRRLDGDFGECEVRLDSNEKGASDRLNHDLDHNLTGCQTDVLDATRGDSTGQPDRSLTSWARSTLGKPG